MFTLYLAEGKIEPEVAENMRSWEHSGFSVGFSIVQSVLLTAGDQAGIERLVQYMIRCPFSLSRLVKVTDTGQVVYKAEKQKCQAFPDQNGEGIASGPKRNFQILSPLDFLAPRLPETGHSAHSTQRFSYNSLFWILFQQVTGNAKEGGRSGGDIEPSQCLYLASCSLQPDMGDADQEGVRD